MNEIKQIAPAFVDKAKAILEAKKKYDEDYRICIQAKICPKCGSELVVPDEMSILECSNCTFAIHNLKYLGLA